MFKSWSVLKQVQLLRLALRYSANVRFSRRFSHLRIAAKFFSVLGDGNHHWLSQVLLSFKLAIRITLPQAICCERTINMNSFRGISLRPVIQADLPLLFTLLNDPERFHSWGHRKTLTEAEFYETWQVWSSQRMGAKFVIQKQGKPIGLVFDYERSLEDGHTKVATVLVENQSNRGSGVIATALFCKWLFQTLRITKICWDVFGFNPAVVEMLRKLGFHEEMRRVNHRFWNGKHWDWYGFAISREEHQQVLQRILRRNAKPTRDKAVQEIDSAAPSEQSNSMGEFPAEDNFANAIDQVLLSSA